MTEAQAIYSLGNDNLSCLFHRAARFMMRGGHHHGPMHHGQGRVLSMLQRNSPMSQRELMDLLGVRSGSLSELLGKLEYHDCITRTRDEQDKRGFLLAITDKGRALVAAHEEWKKEKGETLFAALTDDEQRHLEAMLGKLIAAWQQEAPEDAPCGRHERLGRQRHKCKPRRHGGMRGPRRPGFAWEPPTEPTPAANGAD